jgi:hypothetical protein
MRFRRSWKHNLSTYLRRKRNAFSSRLLWIKELLIPFCAWNWELQRPSTNLPNVLDFEYSGVLRERTHRTKPSLLMQIHIIAELVSSHSNLLSMLQGSRCIEIHTTAVCHIFGEKEISNGRATKRFWLHDGFVKVLKSKFQRRTEPSWLAWWCGDDDEKWRIELPFWMNVNQVMQDKHFRMTRSRQREK